MNDKTRLQSRLEKLAAAGIAGTRGRLLDLSGPGGALGAVLREIDETALPQKLVFQSDNAILLTCQASGRRLMTADAPAHNIAGAVLPDDHAGLDLLKAAIVAGIGGASAAFVNGTGIPQAGAPGDPGMSANALAELWGVSFQDERAEAPPLAAVLDAVSGHAVAWVRMTDDGTTGRGGDPGHSAELEAVAKVGLGSSDPKLGEAGFLALGQHQGNQRTIVQITGSDGRLLLLVTSRDLPLLASAWQRLRGI